jgi:hypothetical protein
MSVSEWKGAGLVSRWSAEHTKKQYLLFGAYQGLPIRTLAYEKSVLLGINHLKNSS